MSFGPFFMAFSEYVAFKISEIFSYRVPINFVTSRK